MKQNASYSNFFPDTNIYMWHKISSFEYYRIWQNLTLNVIICLDFWMLFFQTETINLQMKTDIGIFKISMSAFIIPCEDFWSLNNTFCCCCWYMELTEIISEDSCRESAVWRGRRWIVFRKKSLIETFCTAV